MKLRKPCPHKIMRADWEWCYDPHPIHPTQAGIAISAEDAREYVQVEADLIVREST